MLLFVMMIPMFLGVAEVIDNSRFKTLDFVVENSSLLHGFAGYFDTVLYKDVMLSK